MPNPYMLSNDVRDIAENWERYKDTTIRPTKGQTEIFRKKLSRLPAGSRTLLLGCTPELRDLASDLSFEVTCVDRNRLMYKAMSLLMKKKAKNERFIEGDWLEMDFGKNYYDLIIGHDALNMVPWKELPNLLSKLARASKADAIFVQQILASRPRLTANRVIKRYETGKTTRPDLVSEVLRLAWDQDTYSCQTRESLRIFMNSGLGSKETRDFLDRFSKFNALPLYVPKKKFEKLVKKDFSIASCESANDFHFCKFEPVYVLRKKVGSSHVAP